MPSITEVEEALAVSLRAAKRGLGLAEDLAPGRGERAYLDEHAPVHLGVAHDTALADVGPAGLELRLDEDERAPAGRRAGERRRQRLGEPDERDVAGDERRSERQVLRTHAPDVRPLEHGHARVGAKLRMELTVPDVESADTGGACLQETVGEAARRGADVEAVLAGDVDAESLERAGELLPAPGDEARPLLELE